MTHADRKVAIVDDDDSTCRSLSRLIRRVGFDTVTFPSAEALLADPGRGIFTCLLVDVQLGGISGIELHRRLLLEGNRTPVIFITAYDEPDVRAEAMQSGCEAFFRKTDPGVLIIDALRRIAARSP
jgi:FixJ family two-component response regulator